MKILFPTILITLTEQGMCIVIIEISIRLYLFPIIKTDGQTLCLFHQGQRVLLSDNSAIQVIIQMNSCINAEIRY